MRNNSRAATISAASKRLNAPLDCATSIARTSNSRASCWFDGELTFSLAADEDIQVGGFFSSSISFARTYKGEPFLREQKLVIPRSFLASAMAEVQTFPLRVTDFFSFDRGLTLGREDRGDLLSVLDEGLSILGGGLSILGGGLSVLGDRLSRGLRGVTRLGDTFLVEGDGLR